MTRRPTRDQAARQARRDSHPTRKPWPVLTDRTAIHRARTTARLLHDACFSPDPRAAAEAITKAVRTAGETWLTPIPDLTPDDRLLTEREAAQLVCVAGVTVRAWHNRGVLIDGKRTFLRRVPGGYLEADVLAYDAAMRGIPTAEETA